MSNLNHSVPHLFRLEFNVFRIFVCLVTGLVSSTSARAERPNILFILADDQAFHTVHALGNEEILTPNLDRLVRRGSTFTHAYNMGGWNGAVCIASRAMLNSGMSLWRAEAAEKDFSQKWTGAGRMWSQLMAGAGYQTFFSGKWHVKADAGKVFEIARNVRPGMPNQTDAGYDRPQSPDDDSWQPWNPAFEGFWKGGKHWSEVLADDAVEYLDIAAQDDRPFFMYLAFNAPHDPRQSPREFVEMYPAEKVRVPESFLPLYPFEIGSNRIRDEKLAPFPRTRFAVQVNRQEYFAIITHMDQQIGRILASLEKSGQADNTWVIFTADHGLSCGHHGLLGKQNMYDHSLRVPLVVCPPGTVPARRVSQRIYLQNVMPTTLELAGVQIPGHVEFDSLIPMLGRPEGEPAGTVYGAYTDVQRMVTMGDEKLVLYPKINTSLLFNLRDDPDEIRDLSSRDGSFAAKRRLFEEFLRLQAQFGDQLDVRSAFPELAAK